jgi:hypothetical protein
VCGMSECDREAWIIRRPWPTRICRVMGAILYSREFSPIILRKIKLVHLLPHRTTHKLTYHHLGRLLSMYINTATNIYIHTHIHRYIRTYINSRGN